MRLGVQPLGHAILVLTTHVHSLLALETSAEGRSSLWALGLVLAAGEALVDVLFGSASPWGLKGAAGPLDISPLLGLVGALAKVPAVPDLLSGEPLLAEPLPAAAAAAAAARAAAAVLAALALRYCMAADMALATRGGEL